MGAPLNSGDAILDRQAEYAHWLLRLPLATVMLYHGLDKQLGGIAAFAEAMALPVAIAGLVAIIEIAAGTLLLLGALTNGWITRAGAALSAVILIGAILMVHWGQWHFMPSVSHPTGGMEFQITLLGLAIYWLIRGNHV